MHMYSGEFKNINWCGKRRERSKAGVNKFKFLISAIDWFFLYTIGLQNGK